MTGPETVEPEVAGGLFSFVQAEFPWPLGPPDGRYVLREHAGEPSHVLVTATLGAPQRRLIGGRRAKEAQEGAEPEPVQTGRATLVRAQRVPDGPRWLEQADLERESASAVATLNRALHAHRIATADAYVREVSLDQALVVRVGVGEGEQVAYGRWTKALTLPVPKTSRAGRRVAALRPQERLAALLGGRDAALACEELVLRARLDVDGERYREAALQVRVALEAALAELEPWAARGDLAGRLADLHEARGKIGAAANRALESGLDDAAIDDVVHVLGRLEAALRARTAVGID